MNMATPCRAARSVKAASRPVWPAWTTESTATRSRFAFSTARSAANTPVTCPKAQFPLISALVAVSSITCGRAAGTISPALHTPDVLRDAQDAVRVVSCQVIVDQHVRHLRGEIIRGPRRPEDRGGDLM